MYILIDFLDFISVVMSVFISNFSNPIFESLIIAVLRSIFDFVSSLYQLYDGAGLCLVQIYLDL